MKPLCMTRFTNLESVYNLQTHFETVEKLIPNTSGYLLNLGLRVGTRVTRIGSDPVDRPLLCLKLNFHDLSSTQAITACVPSWQLSMMKFEASS